MMPTALKSIQRDVYARMASSVGIIDPFDLSIHLIERRGLSPDDPELQRRVFKKVRRALKSMKKLGLVMQAQSDRGEKGGWMATPTLRPCRFSRPELTNDQTKHSLAS